MTPRGAAYALALPLALSIGYDLWRMPLQVADSLEEIVHVQKLAGVSDAFLAGAGTPHYFRPLRVAQTKALGDWSGGRFFVAYKSFHVFLVIAAFALFVRALDVRTGRDVVAAGFALLVLAGMHTFLGLVKEAYPVNHFLQVVVLCLLALTLAQSRGGVLVDVAAAVTLVAACLTLESGVLVWVVLLAARLTGLRGVSDRALIVVTLLTAGYVVVRLFVVRAAVEEMTTRQTGYFLGHVSPEDARERLGHIGWLYVYNIVSSALSVLFGEPRRGIWVAARSWIAGDVPPRVWITLVSAVGATALIGAAAVARARSSRLIPIFAAVLGANAALSFAYTKDEIMSVAGVFYALAAFVGLRHVLDRAGSMRPKPAVAIAALLCVISSGWAVRVFGVHHVLRSHAFTNRNDWAALPQAWARRGTWPSDPGTREMIQRLRLEAISMPIVNPRFTPRWAERVFDIE